MARSFINKAIVMGNVGGDPEVRYMPNGKCVAVISIATTDTWRDKATGEQREETEWHKVEFFGKVAETVRDFIKQGAHIHVEGSNHTNRWTGDDNQPRKEKVIQVHSHDGLNMILPGGQAQQAA